MMLEVFTANGRPKGSSSASSLATSQASGLSLFDPTIPSQEATKAYVDYADSVLAISVAAAAAAAFQPLNQNLTNLSSFLPSVADRIFYWVDTVGGMTTTPLTAAARTVLDDTTPAAMVDTLGGAASTGTGGLVRATSPTLVTPILGTPTSGTLTNCTGLPTAGLVNSAVTYAKIQNVSATDKVLGRSTAGAGVAEEIACTAAGRALIDDADATAQRATLGLVIGTDVGFPQNERSSEQFWDCDGAVGDWINVTSGTGATATVNTADHIGGSLHVCGEWGLGTGTTTTGYAAFYKQPFVGFGDGTAYEFEARITNGALSTSGEEFQLTIGFGDAFNAAGQPVDGACFIYRRGVELVDFWVAVTRSNSTETKTVTAVAPAGYSAMTIFKIEVNAAGTSISYSINGSVVATHTTNIPTGSSRLTGMGFKLEKTAGTTARYAYVDWFRLKKTRTAAR